MLLQMKRNSSYDKRRERPSGKLRPRLLFPS